MLIARLVVSGTCLVMLSFILLWGYLTSIRKAPGFVKVLVILIAISNFAGILFSYSMYDNSIYDNWMTFAWQFTVMIVYFVGQVVLYWYFALQYLRTAETLSYEVQKQLNTNAHSSGPPNESSNLLAVDN